VSGPASWARRELVVCADVGSTYTKVLVVDVERGDLVASAGHPTTVGSDVLEGLDAAVGSVAARLPGADLGRLLVCSSAGGGLRLAVVGYEALVTAQAGHRVGLSAGARVVHVAAGPLDGAGVRALRAARPDVVLLVGGTDGGDSSVLAHNAARLAAARLRVPVVLAGNADAVPAAAGTLRVRGVPVTTAGNVLPRIGDLRPGPARAAIREVFLRHVIGGKGLSRGDRFARLVRGATPDLVLTAVELLADTPATDALSAAEPPRPPGTPPEPTRPRTDTAAGAAGLEGHGGAGGLGELVVVDVGGATTDVYSALTPDAERSGPRREAAGTLWRSRTVEADLGVRWSAPGVVAAAVAERLIDPAEADRLAAAAESRAANPGLLPARSGPPAGTWESNPGGHGHVDSGRQEHAGVDVRGDVDSGGHGGGGGTGGDVDVAADVRLAELAVTVALRRHARGELGADGLRRGGRDLRPVRLVIGSGGVLRHAPDGAAERVLGTALADHAGGWPLPAAARRVVDRRYVLAAVGLLAADHPDAAARLGHRHLTP
jgi:hypothetical protein